MFVSDLLHYFLLYSKLKQSGVGNLVYLNHTFYKTNQSDLHKKTLKGAINSNIV